MKTTQAKAIVGIRFNITSPADVDRALLQCKKEIIAARKAGDDPHAAELSQAKEFFKQRTRPRNTCAVCGVTIARGAAHCRAHRASRTARGTRVAIPGDPFAPLGYYSAPVQKIVAKWRDTIGEEMLQRYFSAVATAVVLKNCELELPQIVPVQHWQAVFELGAAIATVCADKRKAEAWILGGEVATNGSFESLSEIRARIVKQGGKSFSGGALAAAFHRLKLSTTKETAKGYRQFSHYKNPPKK